MILIFNISNILLFGRWIKSINPSPHIIIIIIIIIIKLTN
jgi:hypothetical protein